MEIKHKSFSPFCRSSLSRSTSILSPLGYPKGLLLDFSFFTHTIMAGDVINSLENMKLTTEEKEVITISNEGQKDHRELQLESDREVPYV